MYTSRRITQLLQSKSKSAVGESEIWKPENSRLKVNAVSKSKKKGITFF